MKLIEELERLGIDTQPKQVEKTKPEHRLVYEECHSMLMVAAKTRNVEITTIHLSVLYKLAKIKLSVDQLVIGNSALEYLDNNQNHWKLLNTRLWNQYYDPMNKYIKNGHLFDYSIYRGTLYFEGKPTKYGLI